MTKSSLLNESDFFKKMHSKTLENTKSGIISPEIRQEKLKINLQMRQQIEDHLTNNEKFGHLEIDEIIVKKTNARQDYDKLPKLKNISMPDRQSNLSQKEKDNLMYTDEARLQYQANRIKI